MSRSRGFVWQGSNIVQSFVTLQRRGCLRHQLLRPLITRQRMASSALQPTDFHAVKRPRSVITREQSLRSYSTDYDGDGSSSLVAPILSSHTRGAEASAESDDVPVGDTISIWDMDARAINDITSSSDLEALVGQVEQIADQLSDEDVGPLIVPLMRVTSDPSRILDAELGAQLTHRLWNACWQQCQNQEKGEEAANTNSPPAPTIGMYNRVIIAWGNLRTWEGARQAQSIWNILQYECMNQNQQQQMKPANVDVLDNNGDDDDDADPSLLEPNRQSFKSLIRAYCVCNDPKGASQALKILQELEMASNMPALFGDNETKGGEDNEEVNWELLPDAACYDMVLFAHASSAKSCLEQCLRLANRLDRLHQIMLREKGNHAAYEYQWSGMTYEGLFRAFETHMSNSKEGINSHVPVQLVQLLRRATVDLDSSPMEDRYLAHYERFRLTDAYGITIDALATSGRLEQAHELFLFVNGRTFLAGFPQPDKSRLPLPAALHLARAWSEQQPKFDAKLQEVLRLVLSTQAASHSRPYELNQTLRAILEEQSASGTQWPLAPKLMESMLESSLDSQSTFLPTGESFALVMRAWTRSGDVEAPTRCENLLDKQEKLYERYQRSEHMLLRVHWQLITEAWKVQLASGRLARGVHGYQWPAAHIDQHIRRALVDPSTSPKAVPRLVSHAIEAWVKQHVPHKMTDRRLPNPIDKSLELLDMLNESQGAYAAQACNWFLRLCCKRFRTSAERSRAFQSGLKVFESMEHNPQSFVWLARLVKNHCKAGLPETVQQTVIKAFRDCSASGKLTQQFVWEVLRLGDVFLVSKIWTVTETEAAALLELSKEQLKQHRNGELEWQDSESLPNLMNVSLMPEQWRKLGDESKLA